MWKKLIVMLLLVSLLPLSAGVSAQGNTLRAWNALSQADSSVLSDAAARSDAAVELTYVDPPRLLDSVRTSTQSGTGPDVIIADNQAADPLIASGFLQTMNSRSFFLSDLLNNLPSLLQDRCGNTPVEACLWADTSSGLPIASPDSNTVKQTLDWLCSSSDWLPSCRTGHALPGVPLSWNFTILLFNTEWLTQNNLDLPTTLDKAREIRGQYGMSIVQAERGALPMASALSPDTIYEVSSTMLSEDPAGMTASLASFYQAGYAAVVTVGIDSAYLTASTPNASLAEQFAQSLGNDLDAKVGLFTTSQRLPAFSAGDLSNQGLDSSESTATLQALVLLVTYASMAY